MAMQQTHVYHEQISAAPDEIVAVSKTSGVSQVLYYVLNLLEALLAIRFVLKLLAANPGSGFANFMYAITAPFVAPFRGIFPSAVASGSVAEWSTIVAMAVYALIVYAIARFLQVTSGEE